MDKVKDDVVRAILDAATTGKHSDAVKALDEYATQQSRIEVAKVLEFLSNHKLDFQPASGGNFIGLNMEIYTPTEIDNLYLLSINKK